MAMRAFLVESSKQEIYNAFPCNIDSSEHAGSWENTTVALGFPSGSSGIGYWIFCCF